MIHRSSLNLSAKENINKRLIKLTKLHVNFAKALHDKNT